MLLSATEEQSMLVRGTGSTAATATVKPIALKRKNYRVASIPGGTRPGAIPDSIVELAKGIG
jgi:hypothetical protein